MTVAPTLPGPDWAWGLVSYGPGTGTGDVLDAPAGYDHTTGAVVWLTGTHNRGQVARWTNHADAAAKAATTCPHVPGGRVAVVPIEPPLAAQFAAQQAADAKPARSYSAGARVRAVKGAAFEAGARRGTVIRQDSFGVTVLWNAWPMPTLCQPDEIAPPLPESTPGPWTAVWTPTDGWTVWHDPRQHGDKRRGAVVICADLRAGAEADGNALLIAAAPELLAALRVVAEELDGASLKGPSGRPTVAALNRMMAAARAAIAKAEGRADGR